MTDQIDPVSHWTRQLGHLRAQALKRARIGPPPCGDITDTALEACDGLLRDLAGARLECDRLRAEIRTSDAAWEHLFDMLPSACLLTDSAGSIRNANRAAGVLLNLSAKRLKDRELVVFSEDRAAFSELLYRLTRSGDDEVRATLTFRHRERRPAAMQVAVKPLTSHDGLWLWFVTATSQAHTATSPHIASAGEASIAAG